jgi:threonine aldolase
MRHISAPWVGMLENDVWLRNARHANDMAQRLYQGLLKIPSVKVMHPPQANGVFAYLSAEAIKALHAQGWKFYEFIPGGGCRFMCAWDTTEASVDAFLADIAQT